MPLAFMQFSSVFLSFPQFSSNYLGRLHVPSTTTTGSSYGSKASSTRYRNGFEKIRVSTSTYSS